MQNKPKFNFVILIKGSHFNIAENMNMRFRFFEKIL